MLLHRWSNHVQWAVGTVEWAAETEDSVQLMVQTVEEAAGIAVGALEMVRVLDVLALL